MKRVRAVAKLSDAPGGCLVASNASRQPSTAVYRHSTLNSPTKLPSQTSSQFKPVIKLLIPTRHASASAIPTYLQKTPLYDMHVANGATMVPFGGYLMPVQYKSFGVGVSHHFTRSHASLFDVSHMVQHLISGPGANAFLESITPAGIKTLADRTSTLSALLWPYTGGIVDDTIVTRLGPETFYVVTNAGCREKDLEYLTGQKAEFEKNGGEKVEWKVLNGAGLVALQGPLSAQILEELIAWPEENQDIKKLMEGVMIKKLYFGSCQFIKIKLLDGSISDDVLVSRGGYTGEDGFEISIPAHNAVAVTEALLRNAGPERLQLAGLGARDSLRLEAGMCLYGHDLNDATTPVEAGLSWIIGKDRRTEGGFHGSDVVLGQLESVSKGGVGVKERRVGFIVEGAPAREGSVIVDPDGEPIGRITSGCPSPTLKKNIAMGYINTGFHKAGTDVEVVVRGKKRKAKVTKMPFVPSKYFKPTKGVDSSVYSNTELAAITAYEQRQEENYLKNVTI
ncbi:hypothetical protein BJ878DRAFT_217660 [Calycina marina]|uniref:aminomethyltransferase n=1 Tax=Calycina marina TaxID=1763456 RepID=A0A9P7YXP8_9HELO|nr:hypothetical protein BJ878DRAFT_217660 [Calycina marina]